MKIYNIIFTIYFLFTSLEVQAQFGSVVNKSDSIKSLDYRFYKIETKNNKIVKGKPKILFEGYPILYPTSKLFFNKNEELIKEEKSHQKDTTYYNSVNQKIKMVLYPDGGNDSITFNYSYDSHGNIETIRKKASAPKMDFSLKGNYYSYTALIDEFYKNYYLSKDNPNVVNQFEAITPIENYTYRLYNDQNELIEQKNLYGSRIRTIKYEYNTEKKIIKILKIDKTPNPKGKPFISTETEQHKYLKDGLLHEIKYFSNGKFWREEQVIYNSKGIRVKYIDKGKVLKNTYIYNSNGELVQYIFENTKRNKIKRNITLEYTYNDKGNWITCIHFDKKNKPKYLIERIIEYY
ncbi:hypothetical protein [Gaetbulibacter saemankumensis]|uniref:hypothetical protein n=1 Tax=Gaetbulibacter saemankumensis TaxID=311208 RepID=UPI00040C5944|nr:hypothetical protein [Gaetbulibacter saemankumensis]